MDELLKIKKHNNKFYYKLENKTKNNPYFTKPYYKSHYRITEKLKIVEKKTNIVSN
jgi:hypothetical protein